MVSRTDLHEILCKILGSRNVYFNPPESIKLSYPAIIYSLSQIKKNSADNIPYFKFRGYMITIVDHNPDSLIAEKMDKLNNCRFDRSYTSNGLNHFVYTLYNQGGKTNGV